VFHSIHTTAHHTPETPATQNSPPHKTPHNARAKNLFSRKNAENTHGEEKTSRKHHCQENHRKNLTGTAHSDKKPAHTENEKSILVLAALSKAKRAIPHVPRKKQWTPLLSQKQKKHSRGRHSISSMIFFLMEEKTGFIRIFNEDIVTLLKKALLFIRISQKTLSKKTLLFLHIFSPRRILFWRKQVINTKRTFLRHSRKKSLLQYSHKLNSFSFLHLAQKKEKIILLKTKFCLRKAGVIKRKQQRKQRKTKERERFFSRDSGSLSSRYPL